MSISIDDDRTLRSCLITTAGSLGVYGVFLLGPQSTDHGRDRIGHAKKGSPWRLEHSGPRNRSLPRLQSLRGIVLDD